MPPYSGPHFYHQLGNQDEARCLELLRAGYGVGAILSPHNLQRGNRLQEFAQKYRALEKELLIDPQLYNSITIQGQSNLPPIDDTAAWADREVGMPILESALYKQQNLEPSRYIIPGPFAPLLSEAWFDTIRYFVDESRTWLDRVNDPSELVATIAISSDIIADDEARYKLLNEICGLSVNGFYLLPEMPLGTTNVKLLCGLLDIVFRLKLNDHEILMGYTDVWAIIAFTFGLDGFASSALSNRRSFQPKQWRGEKNTGWGKKYRQFWSSLILGKVRFPDDANLLMQKKLWEGLDGGSPYARLFDGTSPVEIHQAGHWTPQNSNDNFSWMMSDMSKRFQNLDRQGRIALTKHWLSSALARSKQIAKQGIRNNADQLTAWKQAFDIYLNKVSGELADEFV